MSSVEHGVTPIDIDALELSSFSGRPVAVLGLARSGVALARFLADRGALVTVYDGQPTAALTERIDQLEGRPARLLLGPDVDPAEVLRGQALIATSPSVSSRYPTTEPRLRAALAAVEAEGRVPVVSEIDLFLRLCPGMTVGVTGTKGKTTTSSLTARVLSGGELPVLLGGNIGTPLVERLPELTVRHRVVLELSELQLPTLSRGTDVAVYTHVSSDHLDRHGSLEAYRRVKRRLAELVPVHGRIVLNAEDPVSRAFASSGEAWPLYYSRVEVPHAGVGVRDGWIVAPDVRRLSGGRAQAGREGRLMPLSEVRLPGRHNTSNVLAAVAVGLLFGIPPEAIREAVREFGGVEHRLETVTVADGIRYVNDSMGTQPDAVVAALRAFELPIVLIAGGRSKEIALDELAPVVAERASAVVLMGESADELERLFRAAGSDTIERASSMDDAVSRAATLAMQLRAPNHSEVTVLLSPAAASFDMFADYAERGRAFRDAVGRVVAG